MCWRLEECQLPTLRRKEEGATSLFCCFACDVRRYYRNSRVIFHVFVVNGEEEKGRGQGRGANLPLPPEVATETTCTGTR